MPLDVTRTRYSLVKGERIIRYVLITRLRDYSLAILTLFILYCSFPFSRLFDVGLVRNTTQSTELLPSRSVTLFVKDSKFFLCQSHTASSVHINLVPVLTPQGYIQWLLVYQFTKSFGHHWMHVYSFVLVISTFTDGGSPNYYYYYYYYYQ